MVTSSMPAPSASAISWISSLKIPLLKRRKSLASSVTSSGGRPKRMLSKVMLVLS